jgi:hypothetical protein
MIPIKHFITIFILAVLLGSGLTSCASANIKKDTEEVAGYTLKNKAELMQQKILNTKKKTVLVTP